MVPTGRLAVTGRSASAPTVRVMRDAYLDQLGSILDDVVLMARLVETSLRDASTALLNGQAATAEAVIDADSQIDYIRDRVEAQAFELLALQQPVAADLRMLVATLRMVADLERIGDLSAHIAKVARMRVPSTAVPAGQVPTIERMAKLAEQMIGTAAQIIADRDVDGSLRLEQDDDEMDALRRSSFRAMLDPSWEYGVEPAIDVALLGRYYERIADHAVSLARRVYYLATGDVART